MDNALNPYLEWLGLRDQDLPPNHYRLLGLERFEDDPHIISNAADGMLARVRSYRPGTHVREWQQLLDELQTAKACLLDTEQKKAYDASLGAGPSASEPTPSASETPRGPTYMWPPGMGPADGSPPSSESPNASPAAQSESTSPPAAQTTDSNSPPPTSAPAYPGYNNPPPAQANPSYPGSQPAYPSYGAPPPNGGGAESGSPPTASPYHASGNPTAPYAPHGGGDPMAPLATPISPGVPDTPVAPLAQPISNWPSPPAGGQPGAPAGQPMQTPAPVAQPYTAPSTEVPMAQPVSSSPVGNPPPGYPASSPPVDPPMATTTTPTGSPPADGRVTLSKLAGTGQAETPSLRTPSTAGNLRTRSRSNSSSAMYVVAAAGVLLAVVVIAVMQGNKTTAQNDSPNDNVPGSSTSDSQDGRPQDTSPQDVPPKSTDSPKDRPGPTEPAKPPKATPPRRPENEPNKQPTKPPANPSMTPDTMPEDPPSTPDNANPPAMAKATPEQEAAVNRSLSKAYDALVSRKLDEAKSQIENASAMAIGPDLKAKVARMRDLHNGVDNFWKAVRDTMKGMAGTSPEIQINNTRILVVEATADLLVIRVAGQNRRYTVKEMPTGLAVNLANQWFDQSAPSSKVFVGAFLLVDRNGKKEDARRLWQDAQRAGADIAHMMPLLDESFDAPAQPAGPPPDAATLAKAVLALRGQRRAEIGRARSAQDKYRLAEAFLDRAESLDAPPAERYAHYKVALDLAAAAVQPPLMWRVVEQIQSSFEVDALKLKLDAIADAAQAANNPIEYKAAARGALEVADACIEVDRLDEASTVARIALAAARKARDQELIEQATQTTADLQELSAN